MINDELEDEDEFRVFGHRQEAGNQNFMSQLNLHGQDGTQRLNEINMRALIKS